MFKTTQPKPEPATRMGEGASKPLPLAGTRDERREAIAKMFPGLPTGNKSK